MAHPDLWSQGIYPLRWMRLDESLALTLSAEEIASVPDHYPPKQSLLARVRERLRRPRLSVAEALAQLLERSLSGKG